MTEPVTMIRVSVPSVIIIMDAKNQAVLKGRIGPGDTICLRQGDTEPVPHVSEAPGTKPGLPPKKTGTITRR